MAVVVNGQSITLRPIATPASGTVNLSAIVAGLPQLSYVEYQLNRRRLPASLSSSGVAPYTVAWNTAENLWNGEHKLRAVAKDSLGVEIAASAEQDVIIANGSDTIKVTPSTGFSSPWSGTVTLTIAVTAADGVVSYCVLYVDGVYLDNEWAQPDCRMTLDTARLENGRRRIFIQASNEYTNVARGMLEHDVIIANEASNAVALEAGASELWLTPGGTAQLAPRIRRADATTEGAASARLAADDFNRADEANLSGKWTPVFGAIRLQSNAVTGNMPEAQGGGAAALWNDRTFSMDQWAELTIAKASNESYIGPSARLRPDHAARRIPKKGPGVRAGFGRYYGCGTNGQTLSLGRYINGSSINFVTADLPFVAGDRLRIEVSGSDAVLIECRKNGLTVLSYHDRSAERILYGQAGIGAYRDTGGTVVDDFRAGSIDEASTPAAIYFSSAPEIARVDSSGLVTGAAVGDADILLFSRGLERIVRTSVNTENRMPHFGRDGSILTIYEQGKSFIPRSWFFAGRQNIEGGGVPAYKAGGANCWEEGTFLTPAWGESEEGWKARMDGHWKALREFAASSGLCLVGIGDEMARTSEALYKSTRGVWPTWVPNTVTYGFTKARDSKIVTSMQMVDEVSYAWGWDPFPQGAISASGPFTQIKAAHTICTVTWDGYSINGAQSFIISGARTSGLNNAPGTFRHITAHTYAKTFEFACPEVQDGTYDATTDPGLTLSIFAMQWFGDDYIRNNAFTALMMAANAVPGRPAIAWPAPANAGQVARRNWADAKISDYGSVYWSAKVRRYPTGQAVNDQIEDMRAAYRENYAVSRRDRPWVMLATAGGPMYKLAGAPHAIRDIAAGVVRFKGPHGLTEVTAGLTRMTIEGNSAVNGNVYITAIKDKNELTIGSQTSGSGSGGTGYLITTNEYIAGVSPLMVQGVTPAACFAGYAYAVIQGATGIRGYGLSNVDPDEDWRANTFFHLEPSSGDGLNYNASPKYTANGMLDRWTAMQPMAQWVAAHEPYLLQPREAAPDYGSQFVATVRSGPQGRLLMVMNTTDGYIQRLVELPGGVKTRYRMTERGALVSQVSGVEDAVVFSPNEVIAYRLD